MKIKHKEDHGYLRASRYPNLGNQLDAIYKGFVALKEQGIQLPQETLDWMSEIRLIKSTFKKES